MKTFSIAFVALLSLSAVTGCKKKGGGGDINATCEDVFAHAEKDGGKWSAGKGDKKAFMDFCVTQKPEVVRCSSMEIEMDDKDCKEVTGVMAADHSGFETKRKLGDLRDGRGGPPAAGSGSAAAGGGSAGSDMAKPAEPAAGGAASTGVKECDDLMAAYEKLFKCDKMPAAAKDAQKQGFEAMKSGWAQLKDAPQASKDAAATGCKASMDGIAQSAKAMGCE